MIHVDVVDCRSKLVLVDLRLRRSHRLNDTQSRELPRPPQQLDLVVIFDNSHIVEHWCKIADLRYWATFSQELNELRAWLQEHSTFGADLALAYLDDRSAKNKATAKAFPTALGKHRATIEAQPEKQRGELARLVGLIYPKGVPGDLLSEDARVVFDQLGTERAKSIREEAEEIIEAVGC